MFGGLDDGYGDEDFFNEILSPKAFLPQTSKQLLRRLDLQDTQENEDANKKPRTSVTSSESSARCLQRNATTMAAQYMTNAGSGSVGLNYINTETFGARRIVTSSICSHVDLTILDDSDISNIFDDDANIENHHQLFSKANQQLDSTSYLSNTAKDINSLTSHNYAFNNCEAFRKCFTDTNSRINGKSTDERKPISTQQSCIPPHTNEIKSISSKFRKSSNLNQTIEKDEMCGSEVQTTISNANCDATTPSKRVFPGPAGVLPKLPQNFSVTSNSSRVVTLLNPEVANQDLNVPNVDISCSQVPIDYFEKVPWLTMLKDLSVDGFDKGMHLIEKYNISWVLKQGNRKSFLKSKIPALCVVLHTLVGNCKGDISAVFRDPTGKISGTIHRDLNTEYGSLLKPGCVFVLREIGVFIPTPKKKYLNITPRNIVHIYFLNDECQGNSYLKSDIWIAFLKHMRDLLGKPTMLAVGSSDISARSSPVASVMLQAGISPETSTSTRLRSLYPKHDRPIVLPRIYNRTTRKGIISENIDDTHRRNEFCSTPTTSASFIQNKTECTTENPTPKATYQQMETTGLAKKKKFSFRHPVSSLENISSIADYNKSNDGQLNSSSSILDDHLWTDDDFDSMLQEIDFDKASR